MPDGDAGLVWFWVLATVTVVAAANGLRDILLSPGATWESGALLGIIVAVFAAAVRLTAIFRLRAPLRDLMLRVGAREDSGPAAPTRLAANLCHVSFALLLFVDFPGLAYRPT